jgi:hypothetical protein
MSPTVTQKAVVFDHVAPPLQPNGVVFGATLLSRGVVRSAAARFLMQIYNRKGVFANKEEGVGELRAALAQRFSKVELEGVGCAALFVAVGLRRP